MKILVCFKVTKDLESVLAKDWDNASASSIDLSYVRRCIGLYDEAALEMALRLAVALRENGQFVETTALTIDSDEIHPLVLNLFAVQFNRVVQITSVEDLNFTPGRTSQIIASFVRSQGDFDWIFMGQKSTIGENGQTHLRTGEALHWPILTNVTNLTLVVEGIQVTSQRDTGILNQTIQKPAVFAIGNATHPYLRIATLRERLAVKTCKVEILTLKDQSLLDLQDSAQEIELVRFFREKTNRSFQWIEGGTTDEKAQFLYEHYLKGALKK